MSRKRNDLMATAVQRLLEILLVISGYLTLWTLVWLLYALPGNVLMGGRTPSFEGRDHHISLFYRFELPEWQYRIEAPDLTMSDAVIVDLQGRLAFGTERPWHRWFSSVRSLSILLPIIYVLWQLRRLLTSLRGGRPFDRGNARRVRNIGLAVLAGNTLVQGWYWLVGSLALKHIQQQGVTLTPRIDWELFLPVTFLGLVILAVAEFFRQGTALAEEQSLTI